MANNKRKPVREMLERADLEALFKLPHFKRFLFRIAQASDMLVATGGSEDRFLRNTEGRRSLGFEIFGWVEEALSTGEPSAIPRSALLAVLQSAEATPEETPDDEDPAPDSDDDAEPRR